MTETLSILPVGFWAVVVVMLIGVVLSIQHLGDGTGIPMIAVIGTVAAWYVGDAFYNDYAETHVKLFEPDVLQLCWWEVAWFLVVLLLAVPWANRWINQNVAGRSSGALEMFKRGVGEPSFQKQLVQLFSFAAFIWMVLGVIAAIKLGDLVVYYYFPYLGFNANPWGRDRIGRGLDALLSFAGYSEALVIQAFGVVAALAVKRRVRWLAFACCFLSWPHVLLDRTRNTMLAAVLPGLLSYVILRLRGGIIKKTAILAACFVVINAWMGFVIANRGQGNIASLLLEKGFNLGSDSKVHHEGLNMYEELCWINTFIERGSYSPSWGGRYFAEAANIVPRALWPGKPTIGLDYAIARGQGGGSTSEGGVNATVSTGLIGQGVVNFGRILGPAAAAVLMSLWVACLARLDLGFRVFGNLPLYACGLMLTFNLGRDITLIILYPFFFGAAGLWAVRRFRGVEVQREQQHDVGGGVAAPAQLDAMAKGRGSVIGAVHPRVVFLLREGARQNQRLAMARPPKGAWKFWKP